jgi:Na+/H+-dicarboxylate symporter
MATTVLAVILGIILVSAIQPGKGRQLPPKDDADIKITTDNEGLTADTLMDLLRYFGTYEVIKCIHFH